MAKTNLVEWVKIHGAWNKGKKMKFAHKKGHVSWLKKLSPHDPRKTKWIEIGRKALAEKRKDPKFSQLMDLHIKNNRPKTIKFKNNELRKQRLSIAHKGKKLTKEHIKNCLKRRPMSSLELKFQNIILKNNLPYKFVGNGNFFIERKNPDFINTNGEKIAVEIYARRHKELFRGGIEQWKKEREEIFLRYGWKILFFDETQINDDIAKIL